MADDHADGACCGSCAHAALVEKGEIVHPPSAVVRVDPDRPSTVLLMRQGDDVRWIPLKRNSRLKIGRSETLSDIAFPNDHTLGRVTCAIEVTADGSVFVEDQHSTCGTYVNGKHVSRSGLHEKDEIRIGNGLVMTFVLNAH